MSVTTALLLSSGLLAASTQASTPPPGVSAATAPDPGSADGGRTAAATGDADPAGRPRLARLVTGEQVAVGGGTGATRLTVLPDPDSVGDISVERPPVQVLSSGGTTYAVPAEVSSFVGRPLDLGLFVPGALADGRRLAVDFAPGAAARALPGTALVDDSTLEIVDRAALQAAVRRAADRVAADAAATLFPAIRALSTPGAARPGDGPTRLHTLTVRAFDRRGDRVSNATAAVTDANDVEAFLAAQAFWRGSLAYSVPAGVYSVAAFIPTREKDGRTSYTLATRPEVHVDHDTTVTLDARRATPVGAVTPLPSRQVVADLELQRNSVSGVSFTTGLVSLGDTPLYATPTEPVATGELYFYDYLRYGDADGLLDEYVYDLTFAYPGAVPADLVEEVDPAELATVDARYHSPIPGRAEAEWRSPRRPWQATSIGGGSIVAAPTSRPEFVNVAPDLIWQSELVLDAERYEGWMWSDPVRPAEGDTITLDWAAQPMAPGVQQQTALPQVCPVCRVGDALMISMAPFVDVSGSQLHASGRGGQSLALYLGETELGRSDAPRASLPMTPEPGTYRLVHEVSQETPWWRTATAIHTEWTFESRPGDSGGLPPGWVCPGGGKKLAAAPAECTPQALMFPRYRTNAGLDDVVPAGETAEVEVALVPVLGSGVGPVTAFSAEVSYDDGATWSAVTSTQLDDETFRVTVEQPDLDTTNGFAALRLRAETGTGSSVQQTVLRAWPLQVLSPAALPADPGGEPAPVCGGDAAVTFLQCQAVVNQAAGVSLSEPVGLSPADVQAAYGLDPAAGAERTVAVVVAYDNPHAEADLAVYREHWGLPACTTDDGCLRIVNQRGDAGPLPAPHPGWALESSLDLDAVSAACPSCRLLLVEADSASVGDLLQGVLTAERLGADVLSNSYGSIGEFSGEQTLERYYRQLRAPLVVATGDYGYGNGEFLVHSVSYPSASRYAVAVGGTSLVPDGGPRGWSETAWDRGTSGCSAYISKPAWQQDRDCGMRTVADVSAVGDPATGLAVYDTYGYDGWLQVGGTSLAAPIVAAVHAQAADGPSRFARGLYAADAGLTDVVGGANGDCAGSYLCVAVEGYDGPTGLGTPYGVSAFDR